MKYNKDFTRALVLLVGYINQCSNNVIPEWLPDHQGRTSYVLADQFQNVRAHNIGPAKVGALKEEMWNAIYRNRSTSI